MARRGRPKKSQREEEIRNALTNNQHLCDFGYWMQEISFFVEGEYDRSDITLNYNYANVLSQLEMGDYEIANCFIAARQLVYLLAEKEGVIPKFSGHISDDEEIYSMEEACSYKGPAYGRLIEDTAFRAACNKYGFDFPDWLNWSQNTDDAGVISGDWSCLSPEVLKKLAANREFVDGTACKKICELLESGADPVEIEEAMNDTEVLFDSIVCLASPRIISLLARYYRLPKTVRRENSKIAKLAAELLNAHSIINGNVYEMGFSGYEGDCVTLDNQVPVQINYMTGYWDGEGYGYSGTHYILSPADESYEQDTIFYMKKAYELSKKFRHVLVAAENKAKAYRRRQKEKKLRKLLENKKFLEELKDYVKKEGIEHVLEERPAKVS